MESVVQWDIDVMLYIHEEAIKTAFDVHFFNSISERAYVVTSKYTSGTLSVKIPNELLRQPYGVVGYINVVDADEQKCEYRFRLNVAKKPQPSNYLYEGSDDYRSLEEVLEECKQWAQESENSANESEESAQRSDKSAAAALKSEQAAKNSENAAKASQAAALSSEQKAKKSEEAALASQTAAKKSEDNAAQSAKDALASQQAASSSEQNASTSEQNALTSEKNAKTSEENAKKYAEQAKESELAADESEANAAKSEANAAESERQAKEYSGKPPIIKEGADGYHTWWTWDADLQEYVDTGRIAVSNVYYATFWLNEEDGNLYMHYHINYDGPQFRLDGTDLVVIMHA